MKSSLMHRYAVGIVIEDNLDNLEDIKVFPIELLYTDGGDLNENIILNTTMKSRYLEIDPDVKSPKYEDSEEIIEFDKTKYLIAKWKKDNNKITPPNVCKGEKVIVYRYSNRDEYYWDVEYTDLTLRKEEHSVVTYSDKPNLDEEEDPINDRYTITVSTRDKYISIHTTDKYGEFTTYDIKLDTKEGNLNIKDGRKNSITLDSKQSGLLIHLEGNKTNYDIEAIADDGTIGIADKQGNSIHLNSVDGKLTTNILTSITSKTTDFNVECTNFNVKSTNYNIQTSSYDLKSSNNTITSSSTSYNGGVVTHDGISIDKHHDHFANLGFPSAVPS